MHISFFSFGYNFIYHVSATCLLGLLNFRVRLDYVPLVCASGNGILDGFFSVAVCCFFMNAAFHVVCI